VLTLIRRCFSLAILAGVIRFFLGPRFFGRLDESSWPSCWVVSRDPMSRSRDPSSSLNAGQLDETTSQPDGDVLSIGITGSSWSNDDKLLQSYRRTDTQTTRYTDACPIST